MRNLIGMVVTCLVLGIVGGQRDSSLAKNGGAHQELTNGAEREDLRPLWLLLFVKSRVGIDETRDEIIQVFVSAILVVSGETSTYLANMKAPVNGGCQHAALKHALVVAPNGMRVLSAALEWQSRTLFQRFIQRILRWSFSFYDDTIERLKNLGCSTHVIDGEVGQTTLVPSPFHDVG